MFNILVPSHPLWGLAFRPLFFFASLFSVVNVFLWTLIYSGVFRYMGSLPILVWHIREMLLGFAGAVIVGFLLTASQNWTGKRGVHGRPLQLLFLVWLLGRLVAWLPVPSLFVYATDIAFWLMSFYLLFPFLSVPTQKRNLIFLFCFLLFMGLGALFFIDIGVSIRSTSLFILTIVLLVISIIAGRVLPFFTNSAVPGAGAKKIAFLDWASHISIGLLPCFFLFDWSETAFSLLVYTVSLIHLLRFISWKPWVSLKKPILWILHISYFWLIVGLFVLSQSALNGALYSLGIHIITIGCMGGLILGMMSRVSLGHSGRVLQVSKLIVVAYFLIQLAIVVRAVVPIFVPEWSLISMRWGGIFWTLAFLLFCIQYFPILFQARVDGKPG